jgi:cytochrome b6-f complex iron-sulfur subunit
MTPSLLDRTDLSRREAISRGLAVAGWGTFALVLASGATESVRFFFPRVVYQPPSRFRIGAPEEFFGGEARADAWGVILVDDRWRSRSRFFVVREPSRIYALSARCPHLGCTVNWFPDLRVFKGPCHGSQYRSNGVNFAGPAPRPLDRLWIERTPEGELVVDTSLVFPADRADAEGVSVDVRA